MGTAHGLVGESANAARALPPYALGSSMLLDLAATEILSEVREVGPNRRLVDRVGIEVRVIPLDHALVVQVFGIGDRLQKRLVADRSADIRGGQRPCALTRRG